MTFAQIKDQLSIISAAFLIGGTAIGGGMLALPVTTGFIGFMPSIFVMACAWLFMTATGLLLLEVNLWIKKECHIVTMAGELLGNKGKAVAWITYLFVCYASLVAYVDGGGRITLQVMQTWGVELTRSQAYFAFTGFFGAFLLLSNQFLSRINIVLFIALVGAYLYMIALGSSEVTPVFLERAQWDKPWMLACLPLMLTSFSYQWIIPSLTPLLQKNATSIRCAIIFGTTLTFLVYLCWQWLVLGVVPYEGENGLLFAFQEHHLATDSLTVLLKSERLAFIAKFFAFFALITSFIGMAISCLDFLSDGLHIPRKGIGSIFLTLLVFVPVYYFAENFLNVFLLALDLTGGFGDAIMNGLLPVAMVWVGRYYQKRHSEVPLWGGKWMLSALFIFAVGAIVVECLKLSHVLPM